MAERAPNPADAPRGLARFLTPRVVLPTLAVVLVATVLFSPATDRPGDSRLTTHSTEPQGAQALFEVARRLGWRPERREVGFTDAPIGGATRATAAPATPADAPLDTTATYAVLGPPNDLTPSEAGALLGAVRRGAGLLVVLSTGATLGDSLHVQPSTDGAPQAGEARAFECPDTASTTTEGLINWPGGRVHSYWLVPRAPLPRDTVTFASVALTRSQIRARRRAAQKRAEDARKRRARDSVAADSNRRALTPPRTKVLGLGDTMHLDTLSGAARRADSVRRDSVRRDSIRRESDDEDDEEDADSTATAVEDSIALSRPAADSAGVGGALAAVDSVQREPAAIGFPYGAGRIVVVADPDWLRNDVLRVCRWNAGVSAVRMLEYLGGGRRAGARLVFDEFHQGYGRHPSTMRVMYRALTENAAGRMLAQALVAALLLLAAAAARAIPPRSRARLERRSPLEHVGALSRAYAQVGATRLATRRLVRGVRRRHGGAGGAARFARAAAAGSEGDEEFLAAVAERYPAIAADAALVREALRSPRAPAQFLEVGRALERIEDAVAGRVPAAAAAAPAR